MDEWRIRGPSKEDRRDGALRLTRALVGLAALWKAKELRKANPTTTQHKKNCRGVHGVRHAVGNPGHATPRVPLGWRGFPPSSFPPNHHPYRQETTIRHTFRLTLTPSNHHPQSTQ